MDAEEQSYRITEQLDNCPRCKALKAEVERLKANMAEVLWEFVEWCTIPATGPFTANVAIRAIALLEKRAALAERNAGGEEVQP